MLFNSLLFIIFFAVVLLVDRLPLSWRVRKLHLLIASYLFYAAWNPPFVALLWLSTVIDWFAAWGIQKSSSPWRRRAWLVVSLAANLGLLAFFKYGGFLTENFLALAHGLGIPLQLAQPDIILPVGISFYTFQTMSYTIDVYRRKAGPWPSFLDYALYVTFFPQLVAGPIVRATEFLPQCTQPRRATGSQFGWGLSLLVLGLFEKVFIADGLLAPLVERVFDQAPEPMSAEAWLGTFAFAGQIFCDFAGYSTCAVGVALCLGFVLRDNFRFPYAAIGFSDFWQRWHISLSSWLRDYLYIPLGGNRKGSARTYSNLMMTMLLGGLWHGAAWTFVIWGALHGLYLVTERSLKQWIPERPLWTTWPVRLALALITFALVCIAWVFFRAKNFDRAVSITASMFGHYPQQSPQFAPHEWGTILIVTVGILAFHWLLREHSLERAVERCPWVVRSFLIAAMIVAILMSPGEDRAFIYFQF